MDVDTRSRDALEHDQFRAKALKDIIDVENEMGFGEGEDWGDNDGGDNLEFSKHAVQHSRAPQRALQDHARTRSSPPHRQVQESAQPLRPTTGSVAFDFLRSKSDSGNHGEESKERDKLQRTVQEDGNGRHSAHAQDLESEQQGNGSGSLSMAINKSPGGRMPAAQDQGAEEKSMRDKCPEKPAGSNRVRFSMDLETAEKVLGQVKKVNDAKQKAKGRSLMQEQPWRFGRVTQNDSSAAPVAEKAPDRVGGLARRKEADIVAREVRKDVTSETEKCPGTRDDQKAVISAQEKIEKLEDTLQKQHEIIVNMKSSLGADGVKDYGKLRQLLDALDKNLKKLPTSTTKCRPVSAGPQSTKSKLEQIEELKAQCNLLEIDRERLKRKMRYLLASSKGRERELGVLRTDRERLLERKVKDLESSLEDWELKFKRIEADFNAEKGAWDQNLRACKFDWKDKKHRWAAKLKERETELSDLKGAQEKLIESLLACQRCIGEVKRLAIAATGSGDAQGITEGAAFNTSFNGKPQDHEEGCSTQSDLASIDPLELAFCLQSDAEDLQKLLQIMEVSSLTPRESKPDSNALTEESKALEQKISQTLSLMEDLKHEMKTKESAIMKENKRFEQIIAEKVEQVENLEKLHAAKERDMEGIIQELKNEACRLNKELEQERTERLKLLDTQADMEQKLAKGLCQKEQKWEEEVESLKAKVDNMITDLALKDEAIEFLEEELKTKDAQIIQEKQKWAMAIKEVKQKAAKTIVRFVHGKENGLLDHLRERRRGQKTAEGRADLTLKNGEEDEQHTCMLQDMFSSRIVKDQPEKKYFSKTRSFEVSSPRQAEKTPSKEDTWNVKATHDNDLWNCTEDLGKSLDLFKVRKLKQDDSFGRKGKPTPRQAYCTEGELCRIGLKWGGKNDFKSLDKRDVLKLLEDEKGSGENTFSILQDTVQELERSLQHGRERENYISE